MAKRVGVALDGLPKGLVAVRFGAPKLHEYFLLQDEIISQADRDLVGKYLIVAAKPGHRLRYEIGNDRIEVSEL